MGFTSSLINDLDEITLANVKVFQKQSQFRTSIMAKLKSILVFALKTRQSIQWTPGYTV